VGRLVGDSPVPLFIFFFLAYPIAFWHSVDYVALLRYRMMIKGDKMADYNGWKNYETWNLKLWLDNDQDTYHYWQHAAREALTVDAQP
jgi:hypothetical protein